MATAKEKNIYKGISFPFRFGSSGGVKMSQLTHFDFSRIEESIQQCVLTYKNERVMNPNFGSNLREYIFDILGDDTSMALMQHEMRKAIEENEDRVLVNSLKVYTIDSEEGKLMIDADVHIIKFVKNVSMNFEISLPAELIGGE